jgi:hypothetical protein
MNISQSRSLPEKSVDTHSRRVGVRIRRHPEISLSDRSGLWPLDQNRHSVPSSGSSIRRSYRDPMWIAIIARFPDATGYPSAIGSHLRGHTDNKVSDDSQGWMVEYASRSASRLQHGFWIAVFAPGRPWLDLRRSSMKEP